MKKRLLTLIGSLTLLLALTACGTDIMATAPADVGMETDADADMNTESEANMDASTEADGHVTGINDLITELQAEDVQIETLGEGSSTIQLPEIDLNGDLLTTGEGTVHAWEFPTTEEAQSEVRTLLEEGEAVVDNTAEDLSNLKVYNDQNVLVIYSGSDANLEAQLEALFGPAENSTE